MSLPLILLRSSEIADVLASAAASATELCYEPTLDLILSFARDIRESFVAYFPRVMRAMFPLLNHRDPNIVEAVFQTIALLFKYQRPFLLDTLYSVFSLIAPLLGANTSYEKRPYVPKFAAEAFSYVLRKANSSQLEELIQNIFSHAAAVHSASTRKQFCLSVGRLFFETTANVNNTLHSCAQCVLAAVFKTTFSVSSKYLEVSDSIMLQFVYLVARHTAPKDACEMICQALLERFSTSPRAASLCLLTCFANPQVSVPTYVSRLLSQESFTLESLKARSLTMPQFALYAKLLSSAPVSLAAAQSRLLSRVFDAKSEFEPMYIFAFCRELLEFEFSEFNRLVMPHLILYCAEKWPEAASSEAVTFVTFLAHMLAERPQATIASLSVDTFASSRLLSRLLDYISKYGSEELCHGMSQPSCWATVVSAVSVVTALFPLFALLTNAAVSEDQVAIISSLRTLLTVTKSSYVAAICIESLLLLRPALCNEDSIFLQHLSSIKLLECPALIRAVSKFLACVAPNLSSEAKRNWANQILPHTGSFYSSVRKGAFDALVALYPGSKLLCYCVQIESVPQDFQSTRQYGVQMKNLGLYVSKLCSEKSDDEELFNFEVEVVARFCLAVFAANYRPLWAYAADLFRMLSGTPKVETVLWKCVHNILYAFHTDPASAFTIVCKPQVSVLHKSSENEVEPVHQALQNCAPYSTFEHLQHCIDAYFDFEYSKVDYWNLYNLIFGALAKNPMSARHNRDLVLLFFAFFKYQFSRVFSISSSRLLGLVTTQSDQLTLAPEPGIPEPNCVVSLCHPLYEDRKTTFKRMFSYLHIFSELNPANLYRSSDLLKVYTCVFGNLDTSIQPLALDCIATYSLPWYAPYHILLRDLYDDKGFCEATEKINLGNSETPTFHQEHASHIVPFLMRILYSRIRCTKGSNKSARRKAFVSILALANKQELTEFISLVLPDLSSSSSSSDVDVTVVSRFGVKAVTRTLLMTDILMKRVGHCLEPVAQKLLWLFASLLCSTTNIITRNLENAKSASQVLSSDTPEKEDLDDLGSDEELNNILDEDDDEDDVEYEAQKESVDDSGSMIPQEESIKTHSLRTLRKTSLHQLRVFLKLGLTCEYTGIIDSIFQHVVLPRIIDIVRDPGTNVSPILSLLHTICFVLPTIFIRYASIVMPSIIDCINENQKSRDLALQIIEKVYAESPEVVTKHSARVFERAIAFRDRLNTVADGSRIVRICCTLSSFVEKEHSELLVAMMVSILCSKTSASTKRDALVVVENCVSLIGDIGILRVYRKTSTLYSEVTDIECREHLASLTKCLSVRLGLKNVAQLCCGMNTVDSKFRETIDVDILITALGNAQTLYSELTIEEWVPLLHNCFYYMAHDELGVRKNALDAVCKFVDVCTAATSTQDDNSVRNEFASTLESLVLASTRAALKSRKPEVVKIAYWKLLRHCVTTNAAQSVAPLSVFLPNGQDDEASVFDNMFHIQSHRRARALNRLAEAIPRLPLTLAKTTLLPIIRPFIQHSDSAVADAALAVVTAIAQLLQWGSYFTLLRSFFDEAKTARIPAQAKAALRSVLAVLSGFTFDLSKSSKLVFPCDLKRFTKKNTSAKKEIHQASKTKSNTTEKNASECECDDAKDDQEMQGKTMDDVSYADLIVSAVTGKVLPWLYKYMLTVPEAKVKGTKKVMTSAKLRPPVAIGIAKLISKLPPSLRENQIPILLTRLSQVLRSKSHSVRRGARETICETMRIIGARHLPLLVSELSSCLVHGYQRHVLGFTLNRVLKAVDLKARQLDACSTLICTILRDDIFGTIGDEKDAEEYVKRMIEIKKCLSFKTAGLVATHCSLEFAESLLVEVRKVLLSTKSTKMSTKAQQFLSSISSGLTRNASIEFSEKAKLAQKLIQGTIRAEFSESETQWKTRAFHFVDFGLHLLTSAAKNRVVTPHSNAEHAAILDRVVHDTAPCFCSKNSSTLIQAATLITSIIHIGVPALRVVLPGILRDVFLNLARSGDPKTLVSQAFLKLVLAVLQRCDYITVTKEQVRGLLALVRPELGDYTHQTVFFAIVRQIFVRQVMAPEVYDVAQEIAHILVTNANQSIKEHCRVSYIQFIMDYPQSPSHIESAFTWMAKNLAYEHEHGRLAVLDLISSVLSAVPQDKVDQFGQLLFLGLVMRLTDESKLCRDRSAEVLLSLFKRLSNVKPVVRAALKWYEQLSTVCVAAQIHGILLRAGHDDASLAMQMAKVLDTRSEESSDQYPWKVIYTALESLVQVFDQMAIGQLNRTKSAVQSVASGAGLQGVTELYMLHTHAWVRCAAARILAALLNRHGSTDSVSSQEKLVLFLELSGQQLCKLSQVDTDFGKIIMQNILLLISLYAQKVQTDEGFEAKEGFHDENDHERLEEQSEKWENDVSDDDDENENENESEEESAVAGKGIPSRSQKHQLWAFVHALGTASRRAVAMASESAELREEEIVVPLLATSCVNSEVPGSGSKPNANAVAAIISPVASAATRLRAWILQILGALVDTLPQADVRHLAYVIAAPAYRIANSTSQNGAGWADLGRQAELLLEKVSDKIGISEFTKVYSSVRSAVEAMRARRRVHNAQLAVTDPGRYARDQLRKKARAVRQRKRKASTRAQARRAGLLPSAPSAKRKRNDDLFGLS